MNTPNEKYDVGVIVGRFQVHQLHPGHLELLNHINDEHDTMIVVVGTSTIVSKNNPLPYNAVRLMIQEQFPEAIIVPLPDQRYDNQWSDALDSTIQSNVRPTERVCLYGSRDGFIGHYTGPFTTQELVATEPFWSGTKVRESIINKVIPSADFRAGVVYGTGGSYNRVIPTVDVALFSSQELRDVYMVRKNGETQFRFPGGYVEAGQNFASAAERELTEEVGDVHTDLSYIGDVDIDDWRYGGSDVIHTTMFMGYKLWGSIGNFSDTKEIAEVKVMTLTNLLLGYKKSIVPEHHVLVELLQKYLEEEKGLANDNGVLSYYCEGREGTFEVQSGNEVTFKPVDTSKLTEVVHTAAELNHDLET